MKQTWSKKKKISVTLITILALLIVVRAILPTVIKWAINDTLKDKVPGYTGHIDDFDLALWRGAYKIQGLVFNKKTGEVVDPFIYVENIDISLAWRALFRGEILADAFLEKPVITLVDSKQKAKKQAAEKTQSKGWREVYKALVPINVEQLSISGGELHFKNYDWKTPLDLNLNNINFIVTNMSNSEGRPGQAPTNAKLTAQFQKSAKIVSDARINLLAVPYVADVNFKLEGLKLTELNQFFRMYFPFDVNKGTFDLYMEYATKDGNTKGYVKPFLKDTDVISNAEKYGTFKELGWEWLTAFANLVLQNSKNDTTATKLDFSASHGKFEFETWDAFVGALKNGFIKPLPKGLDRSIQLKDVPGKVRETRPADQRP